MGLLRTLSLEMQSMESARSREFAEYADERVKSSTTLYLPKCKLFVEPNEVAKEPKIPQTLQVHKVI